MLKEYKHALKSTGTERDQLQAQNQQLQVSEQLVYFDVLGWLPLVYCNILGWLPLLYCNTLGCLPLLYCDILGWFTESL